MINGKPTSNIELYYSPSPLKEGTNFRIEGDEVNHIVKIMRHKEGDELYITDGQGRLYQTTIWGISSDSVKTIIQQEYKFENTKKSIYFCIPKLKSPDRFETALEKCTELGVTNFIIFESKRTVSKSHKKGRWEKIVTAAMKQSLRSFLPTITLIQTLNELADMEGKKIFFSQEADQKFTGDIIDNQDKYYFIFGPEGDFTENEKELFDKKDFYNLGDHRLRSETAIIKCASIIS
jgi:16S rRNA (uracil1498-N3)-methyltransferase